MAEETEKATAIDGAAENTAAVTVAENTSVSEETSATEETPAEEIKVETSLWQQLLEAEQSYHFAVTQANELAQKLKQKQAILPGIINAQLKLVRECEQQEKHLSDLLWQLPSQAQLDSLAACYGKAADLVNDRTSFTAEQAAALDAFISAYPAWFKLQNKIQVASDEVAATEKELGDLNQALETANQTTEKAALSLEHNIKKQEAINKANRNQMIKFWGSVTLAVLLLPIVLPMVLGLGLAAVVAIPVALAVTVVMAGGFYRLAGKVNATYEAFKSDPIGTIKKFPLLMKLMTPQGRFALFAVSLTMPLVYAVVAPLVSALLTPLLLSVAFLAPLAPFVGPVIALAVLLVVAVVAYRNADNVIQTLKSYIPEGVRNTFSVAWEGTKTAAKGLGNAVWAGLKGVYQGCKAIYSFFNPAVEKRAVNAKEALEKQIDTKIKIPVWHKDTVDAVASTDFAKASRATLPLESLRPEQSVRVDSKWLSSTESMLQPVMDGFKKAIAEFPVPVDNRDRVLQAAFKQTYQRLQAFQGQESTVAKRNVVLELATLYQFMDEAKDNHGQRLSSVARARYLAIMQEIDSMLSIAPETRQAYRVYQEKHQALLSKLQNAEQQLQAMKAQEGEQPQQGTTDKLVLCAEAIALLQVTHHDADCPLTAQSFAQRVTLLAGETDTTEVPLRHATLKAGIAKLLAEPAAPTVPAATQLAAQLRSVAQELGQHATYVNGNLAQDMAAKPMTHYSITEAAQAIDVLHREIGKMQEQVAAKSWSIWHPFTLPSSEHARDITHANERVKAQLPQLRQLTAEIHLAQTQSVQLAAPLAAFEQAVAGKGDVAAAVAELQRQLESCIKSAGSSDEPSLWLNTLKSLREQTAEFSATDKSPEQQQALRDLQATVKVLLGTETVLRKQKFALSQISPTLVQLHELNEQLSKLYEAMSPAEQAAHRHVKVFAAALDTLLHSEKGFTDKGNRVALLKAYQDLQTSSADKKDLLNLFKSVFGMQVDKQKQTSVVTKQAGADVLEPLAQQRLAVDVKSLVDTFVMQMQDRLQAMQVDLKQLQGLQSKALVMLASEGDKAKLESAMTHTQVLLSELGALQQRIATRDGLDEKSLRAAEQQIQGKVNAQVAEITTLIELLQPAQTLEEALVGGVGKSASTILSTLEDLLSPVAAWKGGVKSANPGNNPYAMFPPSPSAEVASALPGASVAAEKGQQNPSTVKVSRFF